jgi:hypothetical protein
MDVKEPKDKHDGWMLRDVANGAYTTYFLQALTWCKEPAIQEALFDIFKRSDDVQITLAVSPSVNQTHSKLVVERLRALIGRLPKTEGNARGNGYDLLLALGRYAGKEAKADFESYLRDASLQRRETICFVLEEVHQEWALEYLTPMLADKRPFNKTLRLCDRAAMALTGIHKDLKFGSEGTPEQLDGRIEDLRKQIAKKMEKR